MLIDADTHLREDFCLDKVYALSGEFAHLTPKRVDEGAYHRMRFEHSLSPWPAQAEKSHSHKGLYDPARWEGRIARYQAESMDMDKRVAAFREIGVDRQILFATTIDPAVMQRGPLGLALCRAYNDWALSLIKGHEDALFPVALLPAGYPDSMPGELERCTDLGFKAAFLAAYTLDRTLDDPAFDPLFAEAVRLDMPLFVHPNSRGELTNRFRNFYIMHSLARPTNSSAALTALVLGGVFERHPGLRVAFFECNAEWMLYWMHRMDATYPYLKEDYAPYLAMKPSDYVRRNCWLSVESHEPLAHAIEEIGDSRLLMASDYPHWDTGFPLVPGEFAERGDLTGRQKDLIMCENVRTLMRF
jgi:predicted TIM-barrel fold metal-dependent hydrolase